MNRWSDYVYQLCSYDGDSSLGMVQIRLDCHKKRPDGRFGSLSFAKSNKNARRGGVIDRLAGFD
jgi:hypothetical protein